MHVSETAKVDHKGIDRAAYVDNVARDARACGQADIRANLEDVNTGENSVDAQAPAVEVADGNDGRAAVADDVEAVGARSGVDDYLDGLAREALDAVMTGARVDAPGRQGGGGHGWSPVSPTQNGRGQRGCAHFWEGWGLRAFSTYSGS